jgi:hypothetical protein
MLPDSFSMPEVQESMRFDQRHDPADVPLVAWGEMSMRLHESLID